MKTNLWAFLLITVLILVFVGFWTLKKVHFNSTYTIGQPLDSLNNVYVYYNGGVDNVSGRNLTTDGYNLGLKYQCVEFVKRYYYEHLNHKMPDSYGHAVDFFDTDLNDGQKSRKRDLIQYSNPSQIKPKVDDLVIFKGTTFNKYGHVAIISNVTETEIEIIQQNPGSSGNTRETFSIDQQDGKWKISNGRILGWLRKE